MRVLLYSVFMMILLVECTREKCNCEVSPDMEKREDSLLKLNLPEFDSFMKRFNEDPLQNEDYEVIRFSIQSSLSENMKIYRIEHTGKNYILLTKLFKCDVDGKGYENRKFVGKDSLMEYNVKTLSDNEIKPILKLIQDSCFWTIWLKEKRKCYLDGSSWLLEVYSPEGNPCTGRKYRVVGVDTEEKSVFYSICEKIMALEPLEQRHW